MPSGVFQPYTAVSLALLIFIKRHENDDYMGNDFFYDAPADVLPYTKNKGQYEAKIP
ncbi:hypothetical protein BGS_0674 [Beggiatoa sp. SS]|nr:hypothetical protein BGS_0674 [Beggiatoa sp. SS]